MWRLAAESGIVVATHAGIDAYDSLVQMWEPGGAESSLFRSPLRGIVTKGRGVSDFYAAALCHKLFDRFPGLRLASVENGASWVARHAPSPRRCGQPQPGLLRRAPARQFGEHVWITPFWEDDVTRLLDDVRADRLLLGSDWPHAEGTRQPVDFVAESLAGLPEPTVRLIARQNALDLLGISIP